MRSILALVLFTACSSSDAKPAPAPAPVVVAPPAPPPKNLVCEAFKGVNDKATCVPYLTDAGEAHAHTAMVTLGQTLLHCGYGVGSPGVVCTDAIVIRQTPPAPTAPAEPKKAKK
jgi:hypothetical protein